MSQTQKFIHLLYVPTMNCNMRCRYCYLGDHTVDQDDTGCLDTLAYAVDRLRMAQVIPFNISLHGGEVTTLRREDFYQVAGFIRDYYEENRQLLKDNGFRVGSPHIKTNLFGLDRHIDAIRELNISVSGSLDLPFSLHREYRVTKGGGDTLEKILANVELMASLPNRKKVSATIFREHLLRMDELIADIWYLHRHTCLDMLDFNFMMGFGEEGLIPLTGEEQVTFYQTIREAFRGTELEEGVNGAWFAEFFKGYCCNSTNCGDRFFLLERSGDIYSCVRGQHNPDFYYGNIYRDPVEKILRTAREKICSAHQSLGFHEECGKCGYLHLCKTGCPFVKKVNHSSRSYTCLLQKQLYEAAGEAQQNTTRTYLRDVHPLLLPEYPAPESNNGIPTLRDMINADAKLQAVYDPEAFILELDGIRIPLQSQLLRDGREMVYISNYSDARVYVRKDVMRALADYPVNNALMIMLLSGDTVVYGDEQREKQAHVMTQQVYLPTLEQMESDLPGYYCLELMPLLLPWLPYLPEDKPCNLFFTTMALREYHYTKQKNNGYYHIRALNLPFQNMEFYRLSCCLD